MLLLLRNSRHNDNTWGLPGGNVEPGEQLLQVSRRKRREEGNREGRKEGCRE